MIIKSPDSTADSAALEYAPDRLWRRVLQCIDDNKPPSRGDGDALLREGYRFVKRWGNAAQSDIPKLKRRFGALMTAYMHYANPNPMKWFIEAALMSSEPRDVLLKFLGIDDLVLTRYQQYFMDIQPHVQNPAYVYTYIVKRVGSGMVVPSDQDYLYKILVYQYGWKVFTEYLSFGALSQETIDLLTKEADSNMVRHYHAATKVLQVNPYNALEVIQAFHEAKELEKEGKPDAANAIKDDIIDNFMASCKMSIVKSTDVVPAKEPRVFNPDEGFTVHIDPLPVKRLETIK